MKPDNPTEGLPVYTRPPVPQHPFRAGRLALVQATGVVAGLTVLSKLFGFAREACLAGGFGATTLTDAYLVAYAIPTVLFAAGAALGLTFIPVFAEVYEKEGPERAYATATTVLNVTLCLGCLVLAAGWLSTALLVRVAAPGFGRDAFQLTVTLTRYMFPIVVFQALNGLFAGMLQTLGNFAVPAAVSILFNAVIIFSIVVLGPVFGIEAVALGTTVAVAVQALAQWLVLHRRGLRWTLRPSLDDPRLRRWGALAVPVVVSTVAGQAGLLVERMLASGLPEASISALNYAQKLAALPYGVIGLAVSVVLFPALSRSWALRDDDRFQSTLSDGLHATLFVLVPVAVLTAILREPLVRLAFERGAFDQEAARATSYALWFLALGIVAFSLRDVLTRAFYARQDTRTPMFVSVGTVIATIAMSLFLLRPLGHGGLALASSLGACLAAAVMVWLLASALGRPFRQRILSGLSKLLLGAAVMAVAGSLIAKGLAAVLPGGRVTDHFVVAMATSLVGLSLYLGVLMALRVPEAWLIARVGKGWFSEVMARGRTR